MARIMIVEDDLITANELKELLENNGYQPIVLKDFKNSYNEIINAKPDLILLDINIPYLNGEKILENLRKEINTPIIMVTSKNSEIDEALSISYGADDYITKPYNPNILLLRLGDVLKRSNQISNILIYKDLKVNIQKGVIEKDNKEITLTKNEMLIFSYLLANQNKIVTREELMTTLWNNNEFINDNALTVNISRLRSKLRDLGLEEIIETRKKEGYILL